VKAFEDGAYKSFDFGLGLGAGIEVSRINIRIGYDYGLAKINEFQSIIEAKNSSLAFTAGLKF